MTNNGYFDRALEADRAGDRPTARALMRCWLSGLRSEGEAMTDQEKVNHALMLVKIFIDALEGGESTIKIGDGVVEVVSLKTEIRRMQDIQSTLRGER